MLKNFDEWNKRKKKIEENNFRPTFRVGEIWWAHFGENIGVEANGKGEHFLRPTIILRKYNQYSFLGLPLTTSTIHNDFRIEVGTILGRKAVVNTSQLRYMDSKRLYKLICEVEVPLFLEIMKKADEVHFHPPLSL